MFRISSRVKVLYRNTFHILVGSQISLSIIIIINTVKEDQNPLSPRCLKASGIKRLDDHPSRHRLRHLTRLLKKRPDPTIMRQASLSSNAVFSCRPR
ncbi:hypothetical protein NPIL_73231 [Nephila pilipes]|uniref:Uncharacterized protein n=1 Tax=Nephila pilipes TaxID=299642 RepID=A0A8X6PU26_NEPPI|nr:hypothetical protein NPIL_73231 [Nephila pilipes]